MAKMSKAQARKRLSECQMKLNKVHQNFYLTTSDNKKLFNISEDLERMKKKLK